MSISSKQFASERIRSISMSVLPDIKHDDSLSSTYSINREIDLSRSNFEQQQDFIRMVYSGTSDPDSNVALENIASYMIAKYPSLSRNFTKKNAATLMELTMGYDPKSQNLAEFAKDSITSSISNTAFGLRLGWLYAFGDTSSDKFMQDKQDIMNDIKFYKKDYNKGTYDARIPFVKDFVGDTADLIGTSGASFAISALGYAGSLVPVVGPAIYGASKFIRSGLAVMQEIGEVASGLMEAGVDDDIIRFSSVVYGGIAGIFEFATDGVGERFINAFTPLGKYLGAESTKNIYKKTLSDFFKDNIKDTAKDISTEVVTEEIQTYSEMLGFNYGIELQNKRLAEKEKENPMQTFERISGYSIDDFKQAASDVFFATTRGTLGMRLIPSLAKLPVDIRRSNINKSAGKYTLSENATGILKSKDITTLRNSTQKGSISKSLKVDPISVTRVGDEYIALGSTNDQLLALKDSNYVFVKEVSLAGNPSSYSELNYTMSYKTVNESIKKALNNNSISSFRYYDNNDRILSNPKTASKIGISVDGDDMLIITLGKDSKSRSQFQIDAFGKTLDKFSETETTSKEEKNTSFAEKTVKEAKESFDKLYNEAFEEEDNESVVNEEKTDINENEAKDNTVTAETQNVTNETKNVTEGTQNEIKLDENVTSTESPVNDVLNNVNNEAVNASDVTNTAVDNTVTADNKETVEETIPENKEATKESTDSKTAIESIKEEVKAESQQELSSDVKANDTADNAQAEPIAYDNKKSESDDKDENPAITGEYQKSLDEMNSIQQEYSDAMESLSYEGDSSESEGDNLTRIKNAITKSISLREQRVGRASKLKNVEIELSSRAAMIAAKGFARSLGMSTDDFLKKIQIGTVNIKSETKNKIQGVTDIMETPIGKAAQIYLTQYSRPLTLAHELAHAYIGLLDNDSDTYKMINDVYGKTRMQGGMSEAFSQGLERYIVSGAVENKKIAKIFDNLADVLKKILSLRKEHNIPDAENNAFFNALFKDKNEYNKISESKASSVIESDNSVKKAVEVLNENASDAKEQSDANTIAPESDNKSDSIKTSENKSDSDKSKSDDTKENIANSVVEKTESKKPAETDKAKDRNYNKILSYLKKNYGFKNMYIVARVLDSLSGEKQYVLKNENDYDPNYVISKEESIKLIKNFNDSMKSKDPSWTYKDLRESKIDKSFILDNLNLHVFNNNAISNKDFDIFSISTGYAIRVNSSLEIDVNGNLIRTSIKDSDSWIYVPISDNNDLVSVSSIIKTLGSDQKDTNNRSFAIVSSIASNMPDINKQAKENEAISKMNAADRKAFDKKKAEESSKNSNYADYVIDFEYDDERFNDPVDKYDYKKPSTSKILDETNTKKLIGIIKDHIKEIPILNDDKASDIFNFYDVVSNEAPFVIQDNTAVAYYINKILGVNNMSAKNLRVIGDAYGNIYVFSNQAIKTNLDTDENVVIDSDDTIVTVIPFSNTNAENFDLYDYTTTIENVAQDAVSEEEYDYMYSESGFMQTKNIEYITDAEALEMYTVDNDEDLSEFAMNLIKSESYQELLSAGNIDKMISMQNSGYKYSINPKVIAMAYLSQVNNNNAYNQKMSDQKRRLISREFSIDESEDTSIDQTEDSDFSNENNARDNSKEFDNVVESVSNIIINMMSNDDIRKASESDSLIDYIKENNTVNNALSGVDESIKNSVYDRISKNIKFSSESYSSVARYILSSVKSEKKFNSASDRIFSIIDDAIKYAKSVPDLIAKLSSFVDVSKFKYGKKTIESVIKSRQDSSKVTVNKEQVKYFIDMLVDTESNTIRIGTTKDRFGNYESMLGVLLNYAHPRKGTEPKTVTSHTSKVDIDYYNISNKMLNIDSPNSITDSLSIESLAYKMVKILGDASSVIKSVFDGNSDMGTADRILNAFNSSINSKKAEIEQNQKTISDAENEISRIKNEYEKEIDILIRDYEKDLSKLERDNYRKEKNEAKLKAEKEDLKSRMKINEKELKDKANAKIDKYRNKINELRAKISELNEKINNLQNSEEIKNANEIKKLIDSFKKQMKANGESRDARASEIFKNLFNNILDKKVGSEIDISSIRPIWDGYSAPINDLLKQIISLGMIQKKGDSYFVSKNIESLSLEELSTLVDAENGFFSTCDTAMRARKASYESEKASERKMIIDEIRRMNSHNGELESFLASARGAKFSYDRNDAEGLKIKNKGKYFDMNDWLTLSTILEKECPALRSYFLGGDLSIEVSEDGNLSFKTKAITYNLNSAADNEATNSLNRKKDFVSTIARIFGIKDNDVEYMNSKLFSMNKVKPSESRLSDLLGSDGKPAITIMSEGGAIGIEDYISSHNSSVTDVDDITFEIDESKLDDKWIPLAKTIVDYLERNHRRYNKYVKQYEDMVDKGIIKDNEDSRNDLIALMIKNNVYTDADMLSMLSEGSTTSKYNMSQMMGIYIYAQQYDGLNCLLKDLKGERVSNNLTFANVISVVNSFLYDPEFAKYKELADYMTESIGSKYTDIADIYYRTNNKVLRNIKNYFLIRDDLGFFDYDINDMMPFGGIPVKKSVPDSMVHARGGKHPLNLDIMSLFPKAIEEQEHYIAYAELMDRYDDVLAQDGDIRAALIESKGGDDKARASVEETFKKASEWLDVIKNPHSILDSKSGFLSALRNKMAISVLWNNLNTVLSQFPTYALTLQKVGLSRWMKSMGKMIAHGKTYTDQIYQLSGQMRARKRIEIEAYHQQVASDLYKYLDEKTEGKATIARTAYMKFISSGLKMMESVDTLVANASWLAVYEDNLATMKKTDDIMALMESSDHDKVMEGNRRFQEMCAQDATQFVMDTQSSINPKDNALIFSSRDNAIKDIVLFTTQLNKQFNMLYSAGYNLINRKNMEYALRTIFAVSLSALGAVLITGKYIPDDDDETIVGNVLKEFTAEMINNIPIVGEPITSIYRGEIYSDKGIISSAYNLVNGIKRSVEGKEVDLGKRSAYLLVDIAKFTGTPSSEPMRLYNAVENKNPLYLINSNYAKLLEN